MLQRPDISVVIVNYNTKSDLMNCLKSLLKFVKSFKLEIIIIDNASADGSAKMVKQKFPQVCLFANKKNLLFGGGYKQGLEIAKGKYLLVLAPDILFTQNSLIIMKRFLDNHPECGLASCRQVDGKGQLNQTSHRFPTPLTEILEMPMFYRLFKNSRILTELRYKNWDRKSIRQVDAIPGSFMFGRRDVFRQAGYMDENFKIYYSDLDLSKTVTDLGFKNFHVGTTTNVHLVAQTTKTIPLPKLMAVSYADMLYYYRKHFGVFWWLILYLFSRISLGYFWISYLTSLRGTHANA